MEVGSECSAYCDYLKSAFICAKLIAIVRQQDCTKVGMSGSLFAALFTKKIYKWNGVIEVDEQELKDIIVLGMLSFAESWGMGIEDRG